MIRGPRRARAARRELGEVELVTTDEVLVEFLAALSRGGSMVRQVAVHFSRASGQDLKDACAKWRMADNSRRVGGGQATHSVLSRRSPRASIY